MTLAELDKLIAERKLREKVLQANEKANDFIFAEGAGNRTELTTQEAEIVRDAVRGALNDTLRRQERWGSIILAVAGILFLLMIIAFGKG